VQDAESSISLLERPNVPDVVEWSEHIAKACDVDFDGVIAMPNGQPDSAVATILEVFPAHAACHAMAQELRSLLQLFYNVTRSESLRVRFGVVSTDQCRKFHVDAVKIRLFCTFLGPGTEWIRDEDLVFENLDRMDCCVDDYNASLLSAGTRVQRMAPFEVAFAKGSAWPGVCSGGLVHRSPAVEVQGLKRVRLIVQEHEAM
jgi:hypothetical protein